MKSDLKHFTQILNCHSYLGLTPMHIEGRSGFKYFISRIYPSLLVFLTVTNMIMDVRHCLKMIDPTFLKIVRLSSEMLMYDCVTISSFIISSICHETWAKLLHLLQAFDKRLTQIECQEVFGMCNYNAISWIFHIVFLLVISCFIAEHTTLVFGDWLYLTIWYLYIKSNVLQIIVVTVVARRFEFLRDILKRNVRSRKHLVTSQLQNICKQYGILHELMVQVNILLGWPLFFVNMNCVVVVVYEVNLLFNPLEQNRLNILISSIVCVLSILVSIFDMFFKFSNQ